MNHSAKIVAFREMPVFKHLTTEQIDLMAEHAVFVQMPKHQIIYSIATKMDYVYIVEKGSVKLGVLA